MVRFSYRFGIIIVVALALSLIGSQTNNLLVKKRIKLKTTEDINFEPYEPIYPDISGDRYFMEWQPSSEPIVFLHVPKAGGTSFDYTIRPIVVNELKGHYVGLKHFDWNLILQNYPNTSRVVTMIRDPVERIISNFEFSKQLPWSQNIKNYSETTFSEYIKDYDLMLSSLTVWNSGLSPFLTGYHTGADYIASNWSVPLIKLKNPGDGYFYTDKNDIFDGLKEWHKNSTGDTSNRNIELDIRRREEMQSDYRRTAFLAAKRLRETFWFGILEESDESFELLSKKLGYTKNITLSKHNINEAASKKAKKSLRQDALSKTELEFVKNLIPIDIWLYDYAKRLHKARVLYSKTGFYHEPELLPLPEQKCEHFRYSIACIDPEFVHYKRGVNEKSLIHDKRLIDNFLSTHKL